ncbi:MAG: hypothetical protein IH840_04535 [Candidatus Heimdallarchaeota archaeon]|nr:hypothetical protein [Candidatus Heimdallarchaeota archaeon]
MTEDVKGGIDLTAGFSRRKSLQSINPYLKEAVQLRESVEITQSQIKLSYEGFNQLMDLIDSSTHLDDLREKAAILKSDIESKRDDLSAKQETILDGSEARLKEFKRSITEKGYGQDVFDFD